MPRAGLRATLQRIEHSTRGYDYLSAQGFTNILARDALGMPLEPHEREYLARVNQARAERLARRAGIPPKDPTCALCDEGVPHEH